MTIQELLTKRKAEAQACLCPQCAALNELCQRITIAKRQPELAQHIPALQDGITKLKALKIKGIQAIMDSMPDITKAYEKNHSIPSLSGEGNQ